MDLTVVLVKCKEARLISKRNIFLAPQTIAVVLAKSANSLSTLRTKDKIANVSKSIPVYREPFFSYNIDECIFPEKEVNRMQLFIVNFSHDEVKTY